MSLGSASNFFLGAASAGGETVEGPIKSVRFNSDDDSYLDRTPASATNRRTWTWSAWVKRTALDATQCLFFAGSADNTLTRIIFGPNTLELQNFDSGTFSVRLETNAFYRDPAAWYHFTVAVDTTQAEETDRIKMYVNGVEQDSFSATTYPSPNQQLYVSSNVKHSIGLEDSSLLYYKFNGYIADIYLIDGQQLDCTSFGAFDDNGVWRAKNFSGSYGTNGFHLFDFANETTLGNDSSGNDNDFTANNLENVTSNNTNNIDNLSNITQLQNNGANQTINLANLRTMMNSSNFQDADTDNSTWGVRVGGASKKFGVKWSNLTGLTGVSVRWQRASTYDADVKTTGTGITESTNSVTSTRSQVTFSTTATSGEVLFEDVTSGSTNGFYIRAIEFKGYGSVTYPTNAENFVAPGPNQDVLFDVPTNGSAEDATGAGGEISANYATWNALDPTTVTFSEGNLKGTSNGSNYGAFGTIGVGSGKWYWEQLILGQNSFVGITDIESDVDSRGYGSSNSLYYYGNTGTTYGTLAGQSAGTTVGDTFTTNDIIGTALDMDNGTVAFYKNGKLQATLTPPNNLEDFVITAAMDNGGGTATVNVINFGQRPWTFAAPTNYKALCTSNLSTPTVPDGSDYFDAKTYSGTGVAQSITGLEFSPDLVWIKSRSGAYAHLLFDQIRGATEYLRSNLTSGEGTDVNSLTAFTSDGFSVGTTAAVNLSSSTLVAWAWDAGDSNTSITAGGLNSSLYDQSQTWSTYGTFDNHWSNSAYHWDDVFNTTLENNGDGSLYVDGTTKDTWNLSSSYAVSNTIKVYTQNPTEITINEGLSSEKVVTSDGGNNLHYYSFSFTGNVESVGVRHASGGGIYLMGIWFDDRQLVDDTETLASVPAIASTVRANTEAGFSIVSYTGTGTSGDTVAHGLNAVPEFILTKRRDATGYWPVYHKKLSTGYALQLDDNAAQFAGSQLYTNTAPTSSVFSVGNNAVINGSGGTYISYCFTGVEGYSKFGLYNGNGDASDGNFIFLPFRPAFLLIKDMTTTGYWYLTDGTRNPTNDATTFYVWANTNGAEQSDYDVDLLSNGFMFRTGSANLNADATNYVYAAFAENPFQANGGLAR